MKRKDRIIVVLPAYNAEDTLEKTYADIPEGIADEIILCDDCSRDRTVEIAKKLGITVIEHDKNRGYGANQKTLYREALKKGADYVVMIHPDYQYDPGVLPEMISFLRKGYVDVMLGSRVRTRAECLASGMPLWKYTANRLLTFFENLALGQNLGEFHTGFRAYTREVLKTLPWEKNSDDFVFDSQFLVEAVSFGFRLAEVPVPVRYSKESSSISLAPSIRYGLGTVQAVIEYLLHRAGVRKDARFKPL